MHKSFKSWLFNEKADVFGFDKKMEPIKWKKLQDPADNLRVDDVLKEITKFDLGIKSGRQNWSNIVEWGYFTGAIKVESHPASFSLVVKRKIEDLKGSVVWVTKRVVSILETKKGQESEIVNGMIEECRKIDEQMVDMPSKNFTKIENLVSKITYHMRLKSQEKFIFKGVKKIKENNYITSWQMAGMGVEAPSQRRVEQFSLNTTYYPKRGLIRCWASDIGSESGENYSWRIRPSEWDLYFVPSQTVDEIVKANVVMFEMY